MFRTRWLLGSLLLALVALPAAGQTTAENPQEVTCGVLVYGDSLAGVGAAIGAARQGTDTCLIATTGYTGGQATAAGVSTMDEGSLALRESGLYGELIDALEAQYGAESLRVAYFATETGQDHIGVDPASIRAVLDGWLASAGVRIIPSISATNVVQEGYDIGGIVGSDGITFRAAMTIDASEWQELYPLIEGLQYVAGENGCLQDTTWTAQLAWYPDGIPQLLRVHWNLPYQLRAVYGDEVVNGWLNEFRSRLSNGPEAVARYGSGENVSQPHTIGLEMSYRAGRDPRFGIANLPGAPAVTFTSLNWLNDSPLSVSALTDRNVRYADLARAQSKTVLLMWYIQEELQDPNWGLADFLGYQNVPRGFDNPHLGNRLEQLLPLSNYVREALRLSLTEEVLNGHHLKLRGQDQWSGSVMTGAYFTDTHSCGVDPALGSGDGLYDVPVGVFIPKQFNGFLTGMARAGGVDRAAASSLRMQPTELIGGQVVGTLAGMAVNNGVRASMVDVTWLRQVLQSQGVMIDVP